MALRLPGCLIEFGALERPGSEFKWQGRSHDFIAFDEGAQLDERTVRLVMAWLRTADPNQRCRVVIASNPPIGGEGEWLLTWFAPWLDPRFPIPRRRANCAGAACAPTDDRLGRRPRRHTIDGMNLRALLHVHSGAALRQPLPRRPTIEAQLMGMAEPLRSKLLNGDFLAGREDGADPGDPMGLDRAGAGEVDAGRRPRREDDHARGSTSRKASRLHRRWRPCTATGSRR